MLNVHLLHWSANIYIYIWFALWIQNFKVIYVSSSFWNGVWMMVVMVCVFQNIDIVSIYFKMLLFFRFNFWNLTWLEIRKIWPYTTQNLKIWMLFKWGFGAIFLHWNLIYIYIYYWYDYGNNNIVIKIVSTRIIY